GKVSGAPRSDRASLATAAIRSAASTRGRSMPRTPADVFAPARLRCHRFASVNSTMSLKMARDPGVLSQAASGTTVNACQEQGKRTNHVLFLHHGPYGRHAVSRRQVVSTLRVLRARCNLTNQSALDKAQ